MPFVAACDKFIYTENLAYANKSNGPQRRTQTKASHPAAQLKADTAVVT